MAGDATDPDVSDTLTFSKIAGPGWLAVAANGNLSGVPNIDDIGPNSFTVRVTDFSGEYDEAMLNIDVESPNKANSWFLY